MNANVRLSITLLAACLGIPAQAHPRDLGGASSSSPLVYVPFERISSTPVPLTPTDWQCTPGPSQVFATAPQHIVVGCPSGLYALRLDRSDPPEPVRIRKSSGWQHLSVVAWDNYVLYGRRHHLWMSDLDGRHKRRVAKIAPGHRFGILQLDSEGLWFDDTRWRRKTSSWGVGVFTGTSFIAAADLAVPALDTIERSVSEGPLTAGRPEEWLAERRRITGAEVRWAGALDGWWVWTQRLDSVQTVWVRSPELEVRSIGEGTVRVVPGGVVFRVGSAASRSSVSAG